MSLEGRGNDMFYQFVTLRGLLILGFVLMIFANVTGWNSFSGAGNYFLIFSSFVIYYLSLVLLLIKVVIEGVSEHYPFEVKRIYWLYGANSKIKRGMHGHKKLKQVFVLWQGKCTLVIENTSERATVELSKTGYGVSIDSGFWREVNLSDDSILLVLADSVYDKSDYIMNYDEYKIWSKSFNA